MDAVYTPHTHPSERGMALVMTLGLLFTLSLIVLAIDAQIRHTARIVSAERDYRQAIALCESGFALAQALLDEDEARDRTVDHLQETWATPVPLHDLGQGQLSVIITDEQARFDLNWLIDGQGRALPSRIAQAQRLFLALGIDPQLVEAIVDWIDTDSLSLPNGAERAPSDRPNGGYRPPNAPMRSIDELQNVRGMTPDTIRKLNPYVTAQTSGWPAINLNTASLPVLQSLEFERTVGMAGPVMTARPILQLASLDKVPGLAPYADALRRITQDRIGITLRSNRFRVQTTAIINGLVLRQSAILLRHSGITSILYRMPT